MIKVLRNSETGIKRIVNEKGEDLVPACLNIEISEISQDVKLVECKEASSNKIATLLRRFLINFNTEKCMELFGPCYCAAINDCVYKVNFAGIVYYFDENLNLLTNGVGHVKAIGKDAPDEYLVVQMKDGKYICDWKFNKIAGPFLDVSDLDEFGQVVVTIRESGTIKQMVLLMLGDKYHQFNFCVECYNLKLLDLGIFKFVKNGLCGIIDEDGKEVIQAQYQDIVYECGSDIMLTETYYILKNNNKYGLATKDGKVILECEYDSISRLGNCMLAVQTKPDGEPKTVTVFGDKILD